MLDHSYLRFKNCWNKSFRTSKILTFLYQEFSNLLISQRDMSGPRLGALSNNRWLGGISDATVLTHMCLAVWQTRAQSPNTNARKLSAAKGPSCNLPAHPECSCWWSPLPWQRQLSQDHHWGLAVPSPGRSTSGHLLRRLSRFAILPDVPEMTKQENHLTLLYSNDIYIYILYYTSIYFSILLKYNIWYKMHIYNVYYLIHDTHRLNWFCIDQKWSWMKLNWFWIDLTWFWRPELILNWS